MERTNSCAACGEPCLRKFCSPRCGNRYRYQNDPKTREKTKMSAQRYRDENRERVNVGFRQLRSETVEYVEANIYWCLKYGDQERREELAQDIIDLGLGGYSTGVIEDFLTEYLNE